MKTLFSRSVGMSVFAQLDSETFRKVSGWSEVAKDNTNTQTYGCMCTHTHATSELMRAGEVLSHGGGGGQR